MILLSIFSGRTFESVFSLFFQVSFIMRLLWIAITLAMFQCSRGEEVESSTLDFDLINSVFNITQTDPIQTKSSGYPEKPIDPSNVSRLRLLEDFISSELPNLMHFVVVFEQPCGFGECIPYYQCANGKSLLLIINIEFSCKLIAVCLFSTVQARSLHLELEFWMLESVRQLLFFPMFFTKCNNNRCEQSHNGEFSF